jgi:DNA-binding NarL/FixJ family response regulator
MALKILLADDHSVVRYGLSLILREHYPDCIIEQVDNFNSAFEKVNNIKYDLLILDINLPFGNNIQMVSKIREIDTAIKIVIFSAYEDAIYSSRYINSGANAYLNKNKDEKEITKTLIEIIEKDISETKKNIPSESIINTLSDRELQIATLLCKGYGNLEISNELDIKMSTISTYKNRIYIKLNISNTVELIELMNIYR